MGIRFRRILGLEGIAHYGIVENLRTIFRRFTGIRLGTFQERIPVDMLSAGCLPYEASRTYRTIVTEFQCRRSQAQIEVQRQLRRV